MATLQDRTAIVTGASRGIGHAIAERLARDGMSLVLGYLEHEAQAKSLQAALEADGRKAILVRGDVTEEATAVKLVETAVEHFGRLDCLVNNAGITRDGLLARLDSPAYREVLDVNFVGAVAVAAAAIERMVEGHFGRIVNIASFVGQKGNFGQANYAASKAALIAWTKSAALELSRYGITVNAVCPGFIETDMLRTIPQGVRERLLEQVPLRRFGTPTEVADAVAYVLSADYMTGAQININGGIYL